MTLTNRNHVDVELVDLDTGCFWCSWKRGGGRLSFTSDWTDLGV